MNRSLLRLMVVTGCALVLFGARPVFAYDIIEPTFGYQTAVSSITTNIVTISTSGASTGATQVDNPQLGMRVVVEIQNIDSSANLWCLPVSSAPTTNNGRKIAAGASWVVSSMDVFYNTVYSSSTNPNVITSTSTAKFWCVSDGAAGTKAAVTQEF